MPGVGWLIRHDAGTGRETALGIRLVDYARSQGWKVVFAGGDRQGMPEPKWVIERAMYKLRWQRVNIAQLSPGRVIAYAHNVHTNEALRQAGVQVQTFPGEMLAIRKVASGLPLLETFRE
jgi:hypothetical protein